MKIGADLDASELTVVLDVRHPLAFLALAPAIEFGRELDRTINWLPFAAEPLRPPSASAVDDDRGVRHRRHRARMIAREIAIYAQAQGLTIRPLLSRLGLTRRTRKQRQFEEAVARIAAAEASSNALERMREQHLLSRPIANRLQRRFEDWVEVRSQNLFRMIAEDPSLAEANVRLMQQEIGHAQKQALQRLLRRGVISEEVHSEFVTNIDELLKSPSTMDWILAAESAAPTTPLPPSQTMKSPPTTQIVRFLDKVKAEESTAIIPLLPSSIIPSH